MSLMVLGGEGRRVEEGALSHPFEPLASWSRAAVVRQGRTSRVPASSESHSQRATDFNVFWEDIRRTLEQRVSRSPENRIQPAIASVNLLSSQDRSSGAIQFDKSLLVTWGPQESAWEDHLKGIYVRASQSLDRRIQPTISAVGSPYLRGRLTGPIQFMRNLLETWELKPGDAAPLLGFEQSDQNYVRDLLSGRAVLTGRDVKDRIAYLLHIRMTLSALFRSEDVENQWLREQHPMLDNQTPICLLLDGGMEKLLLIKEYVDAAAGR